MAVTSFSTLLGFALPTTGDLPGTWGDTVNTSITALIDSAVAGTATASVASANWTLTNTQGVANEARAAILIPTGSPGVSRNIIVPSQSKAYIVINQSNAAVVVKGAATTGATIAVGLSALVAWNGTDFKVIASSASGTVTTISVASSNGFAGTVATPTSTPVITLTTTATGILKGDGSAISAAVAGTDYPGITTANVFTGIQTIQGVRISRGAGSNANNILIGEGGGGLAANTTGNYNYCLGLSMSNCTTGSYNLALGRGALDALVTYSECIGVGHDAAVGGSNQMRLGGTGITVYTQSGTVSASDERDKADIRDISLGLDFINGLRPVDYKWDIRLDYARPKPEKGNLSDEDYTAAMLKWAEDVKPANLKHDGTHKRNRYHHGLIAQEVQSVIKETGVDFGGYQDFEVNGGEALQAIVYEELIAPLIKAVQELNAKFEAYVLTHP